VRIHPSYRGQGLAGRLNNALTRYAAQEGATVARLCTGSSNLASRRHLDKIGFKLSQRYQRLQSDRPLNNPPRGIKRLRKFNPQVWRWITSQPEFERSHQTFSDGWTWYPLDSKALRRFVSQGGVLCTASAPISSCSLFSREEGRITLGFTAGNPDEISLHGKYLRNVAAKRGDKVRALVPKGTRLVRALESVGFEKSGTILVYEKQLTSKVQKP
jgi:acetyltransferase (GNAT) family protein